MQPYKRRPEICEYFLQGKCRFGDKCYKSHQTIQMHIIRHAESQYNQILQEFINRTQKEAFSEQAKQFQLDQKLIDCGITQKGIKSIERFKIPVNQFEKTQKKKLATISYDLLLVSPLERALITADLLIKHQKIKAKKIIVLPRLTEVLSKICDFSGSIQQKAQRYKDFDFSLFRRKINFDLNAQMDNSQKEKESTYSFLKLSKQEKNNCEFIENWQDQLISQVTEARINQKQKFGKRYMEILKAVFPTPLQSSQDCFKRTNLVLQQIRTICQYNGAQRICIISHNRILKYVDGRWNRGRAESMGNCQLRINYI